MNMYGRQIRLTVLIKNYLDLLKDLYNRFNCDLTGTLHHIPGLLRGLGDCAVSMLSYLVCHLLSDPI